MKRTDIKIPHERGDLKRFIVELIKNYLFIIKNYLNGWKKGTFNTVTGSGINYEKLVELKLEKPILEREHGWVTHAKRKAKKDERRN